MDNTEKEKDIKNLESDIDNHQNDYKFLLKKLKNIKENINLIEKNFLERKK